MAAKVFEVSDVLPATTRLRISWTETFPYDFADHLYNNPVKTDSNNFNLANGDSSRSSSSINGELITSFLAMGDPPYHWLSPYDTQQYIEIDTSAWSLSKRTVSTSTNTILYWEEIVTGYSITYEENGGTPISDIEEVTELPTLPTPTKSGYTFVNWYYDSAFTQKATAGDTIESNVTLYAKWHNLGSLFTEIADAIRSKDGTSENIRDVDFGERVKQIQGAKEEETKTVTPNFSSGNVDVTPTSGKVMTQVTINKDSNLIAENIKKDVTVHGITGTLESGGGSGGYDVVVKNDGGGNEIDMLVKFSDGTGLHVSFPYSLPSTTYDDIRLKNVVWLKVISYFDAWVLSTGITEAQATNSAGYTLTENVYIVLED